MVTYADGTTIIYVNDSAVSAIPGGLASGGPAEGFIVERNNRRIFIDPQLITGMPAPPPFRDYKLQVECCFIYAPRILEPLPPARVINPEPTHAAPCRRVKVY